MLKHWQPEWIDGNYMWIPEGIPGLKNASFAILTPEDKRLLPFLVRPRQLSNVLNATRGLTGSFTVWSRGMGEAWLPEADRVCLDLGQGRSWLPWAARQRGLDGLLEPVGLFPERYRFGDHLRVEQLASLLAWRGKGSSDSPQCAPTGGS